MVAISLLQLQKPTFNATTEIQMAAVWYVVWSAMLTDVESRSPEGVHAPPRARDIVKVVQPLESGLASRVIEIIRIRGKCEAFALIVSCSRSVCHVCELLYTSALGR